ncbi:MAG TPA: hypothetical protein ENK57_22380 [Polyangiaceae bacterium]|nr:hypothetical protein [Polyangiaceae bacterium]
MRIEGAVEGADSVDLDGSTAADAAALLRNFMVRGQTPRVLAARGLADAVVRAVEMGDGRAACAAAKALQDFVAALEHGRQTG